ncbi:MAG TPA: glycosyltransferase family 1 protein [Bryobacteraceae bacterium]|jgi:glycosyltransferase involved in cell wall biosynthesis|nr:glycosyltransferase family 1 protein [Bryobacteraceae bacterium]
MPAVRIAIDIRRMTEFGVGTYIRNVIRTLGRLDHENEFFLIGSPTKVEEIGALPPNFQTVPLLAAERSIQGYREFRNALKGLDCDLVHIPNLFSVPRGLPCPYVMTVHDMLEHMSRAREQSGFWRSLYFQTTKRVLAGAARIFAVSNFTRNEIEKLFDIPPERIEVVYNAIDERFLRGHASSADRDLIARRYQVTYPFLLYAGRISPHKNVVRMIEAFSALKTELGRDQAYPDLKLIIIGDDLSGNPDLRRTVVRSGVQNDVRFLGFIPIEVLRIFYDEAKVFVFPSLYEGFGLPPLEAMVHGTPVVTSNVSSLPEVVGNAAVLVNPENVFEIMRALHRVLTDQSLRKRMKERGYQQAAHFSWETSVRRILEAYGQVVNQGRTSAAQQPAAD